MPTRPRQDPPAGDDPLRDKNHGIRIQKVLAESGLASRRNCEQLIAEGRVRVNGKLITDLPVWIDPDTDKVTVDGRPIKIRPSDRPIHGRKVCILLNKPRRVVTTASDPLGRKTVMDLVDWPDGPRVFPIGRLDADSSGLLLLTNDGELAMQLTHPSFGVPKQYMVSVKGRVEEADIEIFRRGLMLAHRQPRGMDPRIKRAAVSEVKLLGYGRGDTGDRTRLSVTLREGQNREIRRLMAKVGFKVRRLERVAIGPLVLKGMASGQWRLLTEREIRGLREAAR
ncbi:MAG: rRNA pseudouridine synthase [Phycisphaeraceae bacterium]|nr:rRNA pseudouridine synthase [Phycisphaeraceae bacterium]